MYAVVQSRNVTLGAYCHSYLKVRQSKKFRNATPSYSLLLIFQDSIFTDTQT